MEYDARSTTHPIQQPIANEAEANDAFDDITYQKGQQFIRMLESFLGPDVFRDGIRRYIAEHKYSNTTTADLWAALSGASGKPVNEVATGWTEQPGFPIVKARRDEGGKVGLFQERFVVNYKNPRPLEWKIPLTYGLLGQAPSSKLMAGKSDVLEDIVADQAFKLNIDDAGFYRVQYDPKSWDQLVGVLDQLSLADRVNLLSDTWALVQANRAPLATFIRLVSELPSTIELPQWDQVMTAFDYIDRLLVGRPEREKFQQYARSVLRPVFDRVAWDAKADEATNTATLRGNLIASLGKLNDPDVISGARERFQKSVDEGQAIPPDLRHSVLAVVGQNADGATWDKLHDVGSKTTVLAEKQDYYDALAYSRDPKLIQRTLALALTDELPASSAAYLPGLVSRESGHPELAWDFARANMKALLAKTDATTFDSYAAGYFTFFSDSERSSELKSYAKANLPATSAKEVAKVVDEVDFRTQFKKRIVSQLETALQTND